MSQIESKLISVEPLVSESHESRSKSRLESPNDQRETNIYLLAARDGSGVDKAGEVSEAVARPLSSTEFRPDVIQDDLQ